MIHTHKIMAVCEAKFKAIFNNINILIGPLMAIFFTIMMRFVYSNIVKGDVSDAVYCNVLNMGVLFNITMTGMFTTSLSLAEEKEKHTLRTLMTSSVNGTEFFLGSIIPPMFIMILVNALILFASNISLEIVHFPWYFISTTFSGIISCILGLVIGIYAKSQATASTLTTPAMLLLLMVPLFGDMIPTLTKLSSFLFTGAISDLIFQWSDNAKSQLSLQGMAVLAIELVLTLLAFLLIYKRNGYEKE